MTDMEILKQWFNTDNLISKEDLDDCLIKIQFNAFREDIDPHSDYCKRECREMEKRVEAFNKGKQ